MLDTCESAQILNSLVFMHKNIIFIILIIFFNVLAIDFKKNKCYILNIKRKKPLVIINR